MRFLGIKHAMVKTASQPTKGGPTVSLMVPREAGGPLSRRLMPEPDPGASGGPLLPSSLSWRPALLAPSRVSSCDLSPQGAGWPVRLRQQGEGACPRSKDLCISVIMSLG